MFRQYQIKEKSKWLPVKDHDPDDPWAFAALHGAERVTILAMSQPREGTREQPLEYRGPWYADIDHPDINQALNDGRHICKQFIDMGVDPADLDIYLTGGKGIHLFIDQRVFIPSEKDRTSALLVRAYKEIANELGIESMDAKVYSERNGRMFRPPNSFRSDYKCYKVRVSYEELLTLQEPIYRELIKAPRDNLPLNGPLKFSKAFNALYKDKLAKVKKAKAEHDEAEEDEEILDQDLTALQGKIPACIEALMDGKRNRAGGSFNHVALNVACWAHRSGLEPDELKDVQAKIVNACPSAKGMGTVARMSSMLNTHHFVGQALDKYKMSCAGIRGVLSERPCKGCGLERSGLGSSKRDEDGVSKEESSLMMYEKNGFWYDTKEYVSVKAAFTMRRSKVIRDEETGRVIASTIVLTTGGNSHEIPDFQESAWNNKSSFKTEISGIDGASFFGSDNDVQRIRFTLAKKALQGEQLEDVTKVRTVGIRYRRLRGSEDVMADDHKGKLYYVENGFSVDDMGAPDTCRLESPVWPAPKFKITDWQEPITPIANNMFRLLLECNTKEVIAPMLGWYLLAHIKQHLYQVEKRGILLCVSGVAGTGKNSLTAVLQRLSGLAGESALATLEAPNSTNFPFQQALSNSTTIPRVINELNPKSVSMRTYQQLIELLKASFDSQGISRGRLGGGDRNGVNVSTSTWKVTAPVVTLSEEMINVPAVLQRSIQVDMTTEGHDKGSVAFKQLEPNADRLIKIGRVLTYAALKTPVKEIGHRIRGTVLPLSMEGRDIPDRLRFGYRSVLMAYDWAISVLEGVDTFEEESLTGLKQMRVKFLETLEGCAEAIAQTASITEVDKILRDICVMAYYSQDDKPQPWAITKGRHYVVYNGKLYLDTLVVYPMLLRYKTGNSEPLGIRNETAFLTSARSMKYFDSAQGYTEFLPTGGRTVLVLDVNTMQERNIPVQMLL